MNVNVPVAPRKLLNRKNIFIFPTAAGFGLLFTVGVILFAAVNYENNSLFLLGFTALAVFLLSIFSTYENLQGLVIERHHAELVKCGDHAPFSFRLFHEQKRLSQALNLQLDDATTYVERVDTNQHVGTLWRPSYRRGLFKGGRLKIESCFPFGLVRAWSYADLDLQAVVYPAPIEREISAGSAAEENSEQRRIDNDDYKNIRAWQLGESPKRIIWSAYARADQLLAFDLDQQALNPRWLDWDTTDGNTEVRLSTLCHWVLEYTRQGRPFGLQLPAQRLEIDMGQQAAEAALTALALFND